MFTGIISAVGIVRDLRPLGAGRGITIGCDPSWARGIAGGDSIAINGACQTVTACSEAGFTVFASRETLGCTNLGQLAPGRRVNLERSLEAGGRIDGHIVTGHVDSRARIAYLERSGNVIELGLRLPSSVAHMVASKGSLAVDGISLTVHEVRGEEARLVIIPESLLRTTVDEWRTGYEANIEVDVLARYLARWMECTGRTAESRLEGILDAGGFGPGIRRED